MKELNGRELAGFIKERQAKQVRSLGTGARPPRLAIIRAKEDPVIDTYIRVKQRYGTDIGAEVLVFDELDGDVMARVQALNTDDSVDGIIVQLPIAQPEQTDEVLAAVAVEKDVDGLAPNSLFDPATPTAILWLLAGYNVDLENKTIAVVGQGPLVGEPLTRMLRDSGYEVVVADVSTPVLADVTRSAQVIVSATGVPGLITRKEIMSGAVIVDAGIAVAEGKTVGDVAPDVLELEHISATPSRGGVGPLTVCALFENVLQARRNRGE